MVRPSVGENYFANSSEAVDQLQVGVGCEFRLKEVENFELAGGFHFHVDQF